MDKSLPMNFRPLPEKPDLWNTAGMLRLKYLLTASLLCSCALQADSDLNWTFAGHAKYQFTGVLYPENSVFRDLFGGSNVAHALDTRLKVTARGKSWDFSADYQLISIHSDALKIAESLPGLALPINSVITDDRRWWNLTHSESWGDKTVITNRLDRLYVGYTTEKSVWRFGRQAISWGNGLMFTPMDVFNPFDPATVDKEYKTGDDMLYGQWLFDSGNDLQGVAIVRRNPLSGQIESDQSSVAVKYHGFRSGNEFDLLAAEHYGDQLLGVGGIISLGGALLRGDVTWTRTQRESVFSAVSNLSYSWIWGNKNVSGILEYYYNGFGQSSGDYSFAKLAENPDLLKRLERGELFTLGRHYLAASLMVELSPLLILTPNVFLNLQDPSALAQIVVQYDWKQNLLLLAAFNLPVGSDGSEYGGPESAEPGRYFSTGPGVFFQLAFYF